MNVAVEQPRAGLRNEKARVLGSGKDAVASPCVSLQSLLRRVMEGDLAGLAELALPDREQAFAPLKIRAIDRDGLTNTHPRGGKQTKQRGVGAALQTARQSASSS